MSRCINYLVGKGKGSKIGCKGKGKTNWGVDNWKRKGSNGANDKAKGKGDGASRQMKGECWTCGQTGHPWFLCPQDPNTAQARAKAAGKGGGNRNVNQVDFSISYITDSVTDINGDCDDLPTTGSAADNIDDSKDSKSNFTIHVMTDKHNIDFNYDPLDDDCAAREAWTRAMKKQTDEHVNIRKEAHSCSMYVHHDNDEHNNHDNPHPRDDEQHAQHVPLPSKDVSDSKVPRTPKMPQNKNQTQEQERQAAKGR